jgi:aldehyde:ferredoxin oxidoreductase
MFRTYQYRLYPTNRQHRQLDTLLAQGHALYTAALEQHITALQKTNAPMKYLAQLVHFHRLQTDHPARYEHISESTLQHILIQAGQTFDHLMRQGDYQLPTRLKYRDLRFQYGPDCTLVHDEKQRLRLQVAAVGAIKVKYHRAIPADAIIKHVTLKCTQGKWYVAFLLQLVEAAPPPDQSETAVGISTGSGHLLTLSSGEHIDPPVNVHHTRRQLRRAKRHLNRCRPGSKGHRQAAQRVARLQTRLANQQRDFTHKTTRRLARNYSLIALDSAANQRLASPDAPVTNFQRLLAYKAAETDTKVVTVKPRQIGHVCHKCGASVKHDINRPTTACPICGTALHPDVNRACNTLKLVIAPETVQTHDDRQVITSRAMRGTCARTERSARNAAPAHVARAQRALRSRQTEAVSSHNHHASLASRARSLRHDIPSHRHTHNNMSQHYKGDMSMALGGYANNMGRVNLSTGQVTYEEIPEDWALKYVGARGLGVRYCLEAGPEVDPLGPDNLLCFMNGPLTGTRANMSGRMAIVTKSPLTGTITDSHHGGWSAARLRWAGFDGLLVEGQSDKPVYLYIEDGKISIEDASHLWGKGVHDTVKYFQEHYGDEKNLSIIAIGQAGENLIKFSAWVNEHDRASGRGGTGTVGGAKKLKAIVIKAERDYPEPAKPEEFKIAQKQALGTLMDEGNITAPRKGGLSVLGTNMLMNATNGIGALPTMNSQTTAWEHAELVSGEYVKENILVNDPTCHACPVACKKEVEVEYRGQKLRMESVEYETAWSFGTHSGNSNIASVAWMIDQCNDYGMDAIEMGNCLATYMEVCEKGWNGTDKLAWGDHEAMVDLVDQTAKREGLGDVLAEGVARIAEHYGHPEVGMQVRGQSIPAYDPRGLKGMGLGFATSNRGACHLRGYSPASELGVIGLKTDPLAWEGKGELLKLLQDLHAFSDSLDLCKFSAFAEGGEEYAMQYAAVVGIDGFTADDVVKTGERIYNLERYYNKLAGEQPNSDVLPRRFLEEPSKMPGSEGHVCELDQMLEEYYDLRGWVEGFPTEDKLRELEIIA